jgi:protein SCO1/2
LIVRLRSLLLVLALSAGCSGFDIGCGVERDARYPLKGQVVAKDTTRQELTVKHEDIPGFMPGMTMPFKVPDQAEFGSVVPGDLVNATLVVSENTGYLVDVTKTGSAPLPPESKSGPRPRIIEPGTEVPDVTLTDQAGRTRKLSDWRGKVVALTFIYTRCPVPDFCPRMDRNFAAAQRLLAADAALAARVHLLSVSFDPEYDTPEILRGHAARVGADPALWSYVTGEKDAIDPFAAVFGVAVMRDDKPMQEILHNLRTAVIGRDGRLVTILNGNEWKPEELVAAIREADAK